MNYKSSVFALFAAACLTLGTSSSNATTFFEEEFVCPIGGEKFKAKVVGSNSSFGQRPDGRPYSPLPVYPVIECPENGFLLFDEDFTEDELTALASAIETPEFNALRETETQHYRVWWLKEKAGRGLGSQVSSLLQASWETDDNSERKARYQTKFAETAMKWPRNEDDAADWFWLNLRAVNALRELGQFSRGLQWLDFVMQPEHLPKDTDALEGANLLGGELRTLLQEENGYFEPANLVPTESAAFRCVISRSDLSPVEVKVCRSEAVAKFVEKFSFQSDDDTELTGEAAVRAANQKWKVVPIGS